MPYNMPTPKTETQSYGTARIEAFSFVRINEASIACEIVMSLGNTVAGVYTIATSKRITIDGASLVAAMNAAPQGASLYAAVKTALYKALSDNGHLPAGTVS